MKVLLDECVDESLRHELRTHEVYTVGYMRWKGTRNGTLLKLAAAHGFDCLLTTDRAIEREHNPTLLPLAVLIVCSPTNTIEDLRPFVPRILEAIAALMPRSLRRIE